MFDCMNYVVEHNHEQLLFCHDRESGLRALIGIHNTTLGPGLGGTRLWCYEHQDAAVLDVLRLSEGMTYKAAVAGLPLGGGKAVILADGQEDDPDVRAARFRAFGRFVDGLGGRYITAEDVGTKPHDMVYVREMTSYVVGLPGESGDPSPVTAYGVLSGIQAMVEEVLRRDNLEDVRVAVQGLGKVGYALAEYLIDEGAIVIGTDVSPAACRRAEEQLGIQIVALDEIYGVECDVFSPNALGAIINDTTIPQFRCSIIAGGANNQLENVERHSRALQQAGIAYAVDYAINAGGLINVYSEMEGYDAQKAHARAGDIYYTMKRMLSLAQSEGVTTQVASQMIAQAALEGRLLAY